MRVCTRQNNRNGMLLLIGGNHEHISWTTLLSRKLFLPNDTKLGGIVAVLTFADMATLQLPQLASTFLIYSIVGTQPSRSRHI